MEIIEKVGGASKRNPFDIDDGIVKESGTPTTGVSSAVRTISEILHDRRDSPLPQRLGIITHPAGVVSLPPPTDARLGRTIAIKTLDASERRRRTSAAVRPGSAGASALNHPNIVTIYDIDEGDGSTFMAMELVDGKSLDRVIARGPLPIVTPI